MKLKNTGKPSRPPINGGTYLAVCVYSIDIGEQLCKFENSTDYKSQVIIGFELSGVTYDDNGVQKPYDLSRRYTSSKHPNSGIRKMVNAWNGRDMTDEEADKFDTNDLVGRAALVNVVLKENGYNDIQSVLQIPAGLPTPVATLPLIRFDMDPWDQAAFDALPEWAQNAIKKSTEWQKEHAPTDAIAATPAGQTVAMPQNFPANMAPQAVTGGGQAWPTASPGAGGAPF